MTKQLPMKDHRNHPILLVVVLCSLVVQRTWSLQPNPIVDRKSAIAIGGAAFSVFTDSAHAATMRTTSRLEANELTMPSTQNPSKNAMTGTDNFYLPDYLEGTWQVTQTLVSASTPLGLRFIGGPNGDESIGRASLAQTQQQLGVPVSLKLRYIQTKWGVAEDRLFNTQQRLDAFARKSVVANVQYANVRASNRESVLANGGTSNDPLQTTVVQFKGPAAQKVFCLSHGVLSSQEEPSIWRGYELQRSIFALTNQNTAPPISTDSELIWEFQPQSNDKVNAKLRIAGYLNSQSDKLYFEARNRAVSIQDYTLEMKRLAA